MNREFLKELELGDDVINAIMKENGKDINKLKAEVQDSQNVITDLKSKLEGYADYDAMKEFKSKYEDLEQAYEKSKAQNKLENYIKDTLFEAGAKNIKILRGAIDNSKVSLDDNGNYIGLQEQIDNLRETDAYLFKSDKENIPTASFVGLETDTSKPATQSNLEKLFYDKLAEDNY